MLLAVFSATLVQYFFTKVMPPKPKKIEWKDGIYLAG